MPDILSIDPGLTGSACILRVGHNSGVQVLSAIDLPTCADGSNRQIDIPEFCRWFEQHDPDRAAIENVQPMPSIPDREGKRRSMGATSAFRFGLAVGQLRAMVQTYSVPILYVHPRSWKLHWGLKGSDKEQSRQCALTAQPDAAQFLTRKKDHGRAEAILIALYAANKWGLL